ncbi:MAG: hypothetical protein WCF03_13205 [Nitrososphaeraceae archaeon]
MCLQQNGTLALIAVVEVLRMNPDSYVIIYDSKYDNNDDVFDNTMDTTAGAAISSSSPCTSSIMSYQNYYYNEYREGLVEIAKVFLNSLLNQLVELQENHR